MNWIPNWAKTREAEYRSWRSMNDRCRRDPRYAGRITVCDEWRGTDSNRERFERFYADLGPKPTPEHTIDRIDSTGHYCATNCRWATKQEQSRNRDWAALRPKMSAASTGRRHTAETRARLSAAQTGKRHTDEARAKIGAAFKGKTLSAEHRAKLSAARKGMRFSPEWRANISAAAKQREARRRGQQLSAAMRGITVNTVNRKDVQR